MTRFSASAFSEAWRSGGIGRRQAPPPPPAGRDDSEGSDAGGAASLMRPDLAGEIGNRGLAVGPGHGGHVSRLPAVELGRHPGIEAPRVFRGDDADVFGNLERGFRRRQDRRCAALNSVDDEVPAVGTEAGQGGKQITRLDQTGIRRQSPYLCCFVARHLHLLFVFPFQEISKLHEPVLVRIGLGLLGFAPFGSVCRRRYRGSRPAGAAARFPCSVPCPSSDPVQRRYPVPPGQRPSRRLRNRTSRQFLSAHPTWPAPRSAAGRWETRRRKRRSPVGCRNSRRRRAYRRCRSCLPPDTPPPRRFCPCRDGPPDA